MCKITWGTRAVQRFSGSLQQIMALNNLHIAVVKSNEFEDIDLARVSSKIKDNKGIYCTNLTKKVSHLVCLGTDFNERYESFNLIKSLITHFLSEKYKKAKRLGTVEFVTEKWLDVAISQKTLPPVNEYDPEMSFNNESVDSVVKSPKKAG